eukprot:565204-Amphidinium_carterae.1
MELTERLQSWNKLVRLTSGEKLVKTRRLKRHAEGRKATNESTCNHAICKKEKGALRQIRELGYCCGLEAKPQSLATSEARKH